MDSKEIKSEVAESVRNMSISRRGGVKTRGGRLPPVCGRDFARVTGSKNKVIAPKIPQRRVAIKQEVTGREKSEPFIKKGIKEESSHGRGRGRRSKVFIQTQGFLAEGPAAKTKKREPIPYEHIPRSSKVTEKERVQAEFDLEMIKKMLDSYDEYEAYEDEDGAIPPYRLPLLKKKLNLKLKEEPVDVDKSEIKIKQEVLDPDGNIIKIKQEPIDPDEKNEIKEKNVYKIDIKEEFVKDEPPERKPFEKKLPELLAERDDGLMLLLQFPNALPFVGENVKEDNTSNESHKSNEALKQVSNTFIDNIPEGHIGKLHVMKSGKMRLMLGSTAFEVSEGLLCESLREIVAIRTSKDDGDLTVLGLAEKKMIIHPILSHMSENIPHEDV